MKAQLFVADDFLDSPDGVREMALKVDYGTVEFEGHKYHGLSQDSQPVVEEKIEALVGFPVDIKHSYYRLSPEGNETTVWIHPDTMCSEYAGVLFLNPPEQCRGGTAFWTHNPTGWDEIPEGEPLTEQMAKVLNEDGNAQERWGVWRMDTLVGMKFNRFIAYPSRCFHSRWPRDGWGKTKEDARLVWVVFFNRK